jgi:hypothetical protein
VVSLAWASVVVLINRLTEYPTSSDISINLLSLFGLLVGWVAGRNQRLVAVQPENSTPPRLVFDRAVRAIGSGIVVSSFVYYGIADY